MIKTIRKLAFEKFLSAISARNISFKTLKRVYFGLFSIKNTRKIIEMSNIAIEFNHVSKQYRLGLVSTQTLAHDIRRFWITNILGKEDPYLKIGETNDRTSKGESEYVWALKDIDFKIEQGDVVGIIGKNGAGKSTLLKLLSRVTGPTTGTIRAHGRIGSLLEVGTGFHPEMTGRENIFMNGAILGMSRADIQRKLDDIIDFSGCARYIDTPVKRYSSGMTVRLGFAVAAFLEPEILVVDEVLAVGDAEFQKKAIGKMQDVSKGEGRTVLFVSHNMGSVRQLCHTGILLRQGYIQMMGGVGDVINTYLAETGAGVDCLAAVWHKEHVEDKPVQLIHAEIRNSKGETTPSISCDEDFDLILTYEVRKKIPGLYGYLAVVRAKTQEIVLVTDTNDISSNKLESLQIGMSEVRLHFPKRLLGVGTYVINTSLVSQFNVNGNQVDGIRPNLQFELNDFSTNRGNNRQGFFSTIIDWDILQG